MQRPSVRLVLCASLALAACQQPPSELDESDEVPQLAFGHEEILESWTLEDGFYVSPILEAPLGATRVGVLLTTVEEELPDMMTEVPVAMPELEARAADDEGAPGAWITVANDFSEDGVHVGIADLPSGATAVQVRLDASYLDVIESLTFNAVIPVNPDATSEELEPESIEEVEEIPEVGLASEDLRSDLARIGVRSRASWGARRGGCTSRDGRKSRFAIHHTVSPQRGNVAAMVRGFQRFHMASNGWCDIGYHFLVGMDGTVYEGRPLPLIGAHVGGHNTGNIGIAFVGCFDNSCPRSMGSRIPSDRAIRGAARVMRQLSRIYGSRVTDRTVLGHRQHSGQSTACPGQHLLSRLGTLRSLARQSGGGSSGPRPRRQCRSSTLGRNVAHGVCVQSSFSGCGRSRCSWFQCTDGAWTCTDLGACGAAEHRNPSCPSVSGQCLDDLLDRSVNVGSSGFNQCGTNQYRRCTCSSGGTWRSCGPCMTVR
jgi:hypothetical protein